MMFDAHSAVVHTIGHSNLSPAAFVALLGRHRIGLVVDVRSHPRSRRHPHFDGAALAASLERAGVAYRHEPRLGGLRTARADSSHLGIRDPAMRGFADHMETESFAAALERLLEDARSGRCAIMCAEADPARCHRFFIADALVAQGVTVAHIVGEQAAHRHAIRAGAVVEAGVVRYPGNPGLFDPSR